MIIAGTGKLLQLHFQVRQSLGMFGGGSGSTDDTFHGLGRELHSAKPNTVPVRPDRLRRKECFCPWTWAIDHGMTLAEIKHNGMIFILFWRIVTVSQSGIPVINEAGGRRVAPQWCGMTTTESTKRYMFHG